jgi:inner membrane protein YidH
VSVRHPGKPPGKEPDYRFTLANERTFLAYIRTALGLDVAGLAVKQFFSPSSAHLRLGLAIAIIVLAIAVAALGYRRWRDVELAMRLETPLPPIRLPLILGAGMIVLSGVAIALLLTVR